MHERSCARHADRDRAAYLRLVIDGQDDLCDPNFLQSFDLCIAVAAFSKFNQIPYQFSNSRPESDFACFSVTSKDQIISKAIIVLQQLLATKNSGIGGRLFQYFCEEFTHMDPPNQSMTRRRLNYINSLLQLRLVNHGVVAEIDFSWHHFLMT
jgi:hypothetical protein